jgi:pimeloyl-ACP methyl ester carboxylesterase
MRSVAVCLLLLSAAVHGEALETVYQGLRLNANLNAPVASHEQIYLIIHGTWAHNTMEIVAALQDLLGEQGIASLAPTLSLGVDDREGFLPCQSPVTANYTAALGEIDHWVRLLEDQGWRDVVVVGHSRGAAQVALYQARLARPAVKRLTLLAPMVWRADQVSAAYDQRSQTPLREVMANASQSPEANLLGPYRLLNCDRAQAPASTFLSYYDPAVPKHTPAILQDVTVPTTVYLGTEDTVAVWSTEDKTLARSNNRVRIVEIEGAGHFFRDLYLDDVVDDLVEINAP